MSGKPFRESFDYQRRFEEADRIKKRYPARVPIIVEVETKELLLPKRKYLVPRNLSVGEFLHVLREKTKLRPEQALFLFFGDNILAPSADSLGTIYETHKDTDQFLYAQLCLENTFG